MILALVQEEPLTQGMIGTLSNLLPFGSCQKLRPCTDNGPKHRVKGLRFTGPPPLKPFFEAVDLQAPHRVSKRGVQVMEVVIARPVPLCNR